MGRGGNVAFRFKKQVLVDICLTDMCDNREAEPVPIKSSFSAWDVILCFAI